MKLKNDGELSEDVPKADKGSKQLTVGFALITGGWIAALGAAIWVFGADGAKAWVILTVLFVILCGVFLIDTAITPDKK